jgi:hypothetical protein
MSILRVDEVAKAANFVVNCREMAYVSCQEHQAWCIKDVFNGLGHEAWREPYGAPRCLFLYSH